MQCAVCGHKNAAGTPNCAACGAPLGLSATGTPVSGTPGISTGGTSGDGVQSGVYSPHLAKGVRLQGGNYAVGEVLGQGGFGITYKGGDLSLRRYVAIKEFFPQGCTRQGSTVAPAGTLSAADYVGVKAKFIEEARTLARFSDPGIVRVYGVFEENNTAYMVMEFLEGATLSKRINDKGTLEESEVVNIAQKVGNALSVVHEAGLIHRDLKPDNICLTNDGRVVLIDFGTARAFASGKTVQQTTMLTPGYAPLEQYGQQARFGAYTDIYALAATLYHALTGQVPPQATDRASGVDLKPPHLLNPRVSAGVSQALVWAMQIKAADRPQTVGQFLAALSQSGTGATNASPAQSAPSPTGTMLVPSPPNPAHAPPAVAPAWGQPSAPAQGTMGTSTASIQQIAENQILTNAAPQDVLGAVHRAFQAFGIPNPTVDGAAYRVAGSTGVDMRSWAQTVVGQVTQDARGTLITISSTAVVGLSDYGRGRDETRRLIASVEGALRNLPAASPPAPMPQVPSPYGSSYPQITPPPPIANPYGSGAGYGGYHPPAYPMVKMQGGTVLSLGIIGVMCCPICAPIAWVLGHTALSDYGDRDPGDRGSVVAGRILGIIGTVLWGLYTSAMLISGVE